MGMDRPGIEPDPSRMLSGCDATTPTAPELRRPRVLNYLLGTAFSAEALSRPAFFLSAAGALLWLVLAVGKRVRPGKALKHLQGTVFSAEALSRPARPAFFLPFCCRRTPLVGARCGQTSAGPPVRPLFFLSAAGALLFPFCCRRTPLVGARCGQTSAAWKSAGSEAIVAGRSLWTDSLTAWTQTRRWAPAAAEQAAGALLWFVLAAAKRVRPPSALDAKLFLLVAPWGPIAFCFLYRIQK